MLLSFVFRKSYLFMAMVILLITGCSSHVEMVKENRDHNVANLCEVTPQATDSLNPHCSSQRKTIEELAELGESFKYSSYLNTGVGNPLNLFLFSYDKTVKELVELTSSLISINSSEEDRDEVAETSLSEEFTDKLREPTEIVSDYDHVKLDGQGHRQHFSREKSVLSQAQRFLGVPYRRGGTSPRGFDCSGLVYYLHKNVGVSLPRTAHDQYLSSTPIAKSDLRAGDLVFFRTNRGTRRITHVGVYIGDDKFIHSRSPGKRVTITSLSNSYYRSRFVRGGRV